MTVELMQIDGGTTRDDALGERHRHFMVMLDETMRAVQFNGLVSDFKQPRCSSHQSGHHQLALTLPPELLCLQTLHTLSPRPG